MCISSARRSHVYYCHCKIVSGFHNDEQNLFTILRKNLYPEHVLDSHVYSTVTSRDWVDTRSSKGVEQQETA